MKILLFDNVNLFGSTFPHIAASIASAESHGNEVILLEPFPCEYVEKFRSIYRHNNPNPMGFTFFNLSRWFLMREWMEMSQEPVVFHMESDVLLYVKLEKLWDDCKKSTYATSPVGSAFVTLKGLTIMTDWLMNVFTCQRELECSTFPGTSSDQRNLEWFLCRQQQPNLCDLGHGMIDSNLYDLKGEQGFEEHKDILFSEGLPYWVTRLGLWRMSTLHCWGRSKNQVSNIYQQSLLSKNNHPVRLTVNTSDYDI